MALAEVGFATRSATSKAESFELLPAAWEFLFHDVFGASSRNSPPCPRTKYLELVAKFVFSQKSGTSFVPKIAGHDGQGASPLTPLRGKMSHWCRCLESASATSWEISPNPQTSSALDGMTGTSYILEVCNFHFTETWPDHDRPTSATGLMFLVSWKDRWKSHWFAGS